RRTQELTLFTSEGSASAGMSCKKILIFHALEGGQLAPEYPTAAVTRLQVSVHMLMLGTHNVYS
ncbi:MAG: hypothetical protein ACK5HT_14825, partial [Draconibacterium sp.]